MNDPHRCPQCSAALPAPGAACERCLLSAALESAGQPRLGAGYLDDLPILRDARVIAGKYTVLATIARGGMGVVYRARQDHLNREVAVKMLLGGAHASDEFKRRIVQEAQSAAHLHHPNIVTVHDWGEDDGQPYFSMEFIDGPNLADHVRDQPLPAEAAARVVETLAQAVHYAHTQGVLHRDLKPANVMIDRDGAPRLTDFGLARAVESEAGLTLSGQGIGTPAYAPPEQFSPRHGAVSVTSDVYGLGAVLYFLLTGRPPFVAGTVPEVLRALLETDPVPPRQLNPSTPRDLETICLKCLEKAPERRYATAAALEDDLRRWREGQPIQARPAGVIEGGVKWVRRHKIAVGIACLVLGFSGALLAQMISSGEKAQRTTEIFLKTTPFWEETLTTLKSKGRFDLALINVEAVVFLLPDDAKFRCFEGDIRLALLQLEEAAQAYELALACKDNAEFHVVARTSLNLLRDLLRQPQSVRLTETNLVRLHSLMFAQGRSSEADALARLLPAMQVWKAELRAVGWPEASLKDFTLDDEGWLRVNAGGQAGVTNIQPLAHMPVKTLDLRRTAVTNLEPLRRRQLVDLLLYRTAVHDLEPLTGMPLRRLDVEQSLVTNLGPLRDMGLERLNLKGTQVSDLSVVSNMPLQELNLEKTPRLTDLRPLSNSPVRFVNLYDSAVTDISPLTNCVQLEWLILPPKARNIEVLRSLPLKRLSQEPDYSTGSTRPSMEAEKFWAKHGGAQ